MTCGSAKVTKMLEAGKRTKTSKLAWLDRLKIMEELKSRDKRKVGGNNEEQVVLVAVLVKSWGSRGEKDGDI